MLLHQLLEAMQRHDFLERGMHSSRLGLDTKDLCRFVHEPCVNPYRRFCCHTLLVLSHREKRPGGQATLRQPSR